MKFYYSPPSPFARKARFIIHELKLVERVELIPVDIRKQAGELRPLNPLGKIPILVLDDGSVIYDSPVICEYLDETGGGTFFPRAARMQQAQDKWRVLTHQALGDGIGDAALLKVMEMRRPEHTRSPEALARHTAAIEAGLAACERAVGTFREPPTIGEIAIACSIGYFELRFPGDPWRTNHPKLADWYEAFARKPAMVATAAPPGA